VVNKLLWLQCFGCGQDSHPKKTHEVPANALQCRSTEVVMTSGQLKGFIIHALQIPANYTHRKSWKAHRPIP